MADLSTHYAGLDLRNPIIVSSSGLTDSVEKIQKLEKAGAGAVVLKSLFEEQILSEAGNIIEAGDYPEAEDYIKNYTRNNSVDKYLDLIEAARAAVDIPVIASINCISNLDWIEFARKVEEAGASALELNIYYLPVSRDASSQVYEDLYLTIAEKVKDIVYFPVMMKLGQYFTNLVNLSDLLYHRGVNGLVFFNRFYSPDINLKDMKMISSEVYSTPADIRVALRWVAIVSGMVKDIHIAASTGIHDGEGVIKQLLAGARATQVCSAIYKKGAGHITSMLDELGSWMDKNNYNDIAAFRGKMDYSNLKQPQVYERSQFMKYYSNHDKSLPSKNP
jgi:dihydroorotate dehydrogenase (fumarate)